MKALKPTGQVKWRKNQRPNECHSFNIVNLNFRHVTWRGEEAESSRAVIFMMNSIKILHNTLSRMNLCPLHQVQFNQTLDFHLYPRLIRILSSYVIANICLSPSMTTCQYVSLTPLAPTGV